MPSRSSKQDLSVLEERRLRAGALFQQGRSAAQVAEESSVSLTTAYEWQRRWRAGGTEALRSTGDRGRRCRLSPDELAGLEQELLRGPKAHGYATDLWTCPRIGEVIQRRFGVRYTDSAVWKLLAKIGWTCQRPIRKAKERDERAIGEWVAHDWPRIKRGL